MTEFDAVQQLLEQDTAQNAALLEVLRMGRAEAFSRWGSAVAIKPTGDHEIMLSSLTEKDLDELIASLPEGFCTGRTLYLTRLSHLSILEKHMGNARRIYPFLQYFAREEDLIPAACPLPIMPLTEEDAPFVHHNYTRRNETGLSYILERIKSGPGWKAVAPDGSIAGFILTHDEGALGMLEVLPSFRGMGIGPALEYRIAQDVHSRGHLIYSNVAPGNVNSIRIHQKLGFRLCPDRVAWIEPEV